jgi:hypothetical protein
MNAPLRIVIDETAFRRLVAGELVTHAVGNRQVELILSDIGWTKMMHAIGEAIERGRRPPDPPQAREFLPWRGGRRPK